jgi:thiol-disulfide isomerase/thioredoxin
MLRWNQSVARCASKGAALLVAVLASAGAAAQVQIESSETVIREGEGARRTALNAKERKPFDATAWAKLSDWQNGTALTATLTAGKPVLIVTWTDYLPASKRASAVATKVAEKFAKDGLVVVLVHSDKDWASAAKPKSPEGATLLVAHDKGDAFRKALNVDGDPDFYVIDRAGQLRFADVSANSVEAAVDLVAKESANDAGAINTTLADRAKQVEREALRSQALNHQLDLTKIPELPFPAPAEADYEKAKWPKRPLDESKVNEDRNAEMEAKLVSLPETGWYPSKPNFKGRAILIYEWHPLIRAFNTFMPDFDQIQKEYGRDLVVVGLLSKVENFNGVKFTTKENSPEELKKGFDRMVKDYNIQHYIAMSPDYSPYTTVTGESSQPVPSVTLLSTDMRARYWNHPEKSRTSLRAALLSVIQHDPGIIARRKVEEEWIKAQRKGDASGVQADKITKPEGGG